MAGRYYEMTLRASYANQLCINRWFYELVGTPASVTGSFALAAAAGWIFEGADFDEGTFAATMQDLVVTSFAFEEVIIRDLYSVTDFYTLPFIPAIGGSAAGEGMSPFEAYAFSTSRVRSDIRRGQKRIPGCSETLVGVEGIITGAGETLMLNMAAAMTNNLEYDDEGNTLTFNPVILGFEKYVVPDSGKDAYRPYATEVLQSDHVAQGFLWSPKPRTSTQNSRKVGRGA